MTDCNALFHFFQLQILIFFPVKNFFFFFQLQIWDTAGQERFRTITQSYYRSANAVLIAYDITKKESFSNVHRWLEDVKKYAGPNIVQMLIGKTSFIVLWFHFHYNWY